MGQNMGINRWVQVFFAALMLAFCGLAEAESFRFFTGPYPGLATNPDRQLSAEPKSPAIFNLG